MFTDGKECTETDEIKQKNTCDANGMTLLFMRNQWHWEQMYETYGKATLQKYFLTAGPIVTDKPGDYTDCAMNSKSNSDCSRNWKAPDGGMHCTHTKMYSRKPLKRAVYRYESLLS